MPEEAETFPVIEEKVWKDRISALPEDLLVEILLLLPTKDAAATAILSRRWRSVWKILPKLVYRDTDDCKSVWWFVEKTLKLHKAPVLYYLRVELGSACPVDDVDVGRWVVNAVDHCIRFLIFNLQWLAGPISLSESLYICKTLKKLILMNKILVDVPSQACFPSLLELELNCVVYKDEDSLVRLLSSCPILRNLCVERDKNDNVINFSVKVPSLHLLWYFNESSDHVGHIGGSLIIDSPRLGIFYLSDNSEDACLVENMDLFMAGVCGDSHPNDKFLRFLSSVMYLNLDLCEKIDTFCSAINFSQLIECKLRPLYPEYWAESVMLFLRNSPKLKVLMIDSNFIDESEDLPLWSSVPGCLSSHLEIFEWMEYGGTRQEKQLLTYILANSKCLKTAGISMRSSYDNEEKEKMMDELKSMSRVSTPSQLLFSTQFKWRSLEQHFIFDLF